MRRQLAILDFAVGSMRRRLAKSLALSLGLAFVVALFASALFLTDALEREYAIGADRMPDLTVQRLVAGRPALIEASLAEPLADIPAVRRVTPRVWGYYFFRALEANVTIVGAAPDEALDVALERGRLPRGDGEVAVGTALADLLGLRVGDELGVPMGDEVIFSDVVGTFGDASALRTADLVVATPEHARRLLGVPEGMATDLAIDLTTLDEAGVVSEHVAARVEGARVLDARLLRRTYELTFDTRGRPARRHAGARARRLPPLGLGAPHGPRRRRAPRDRRAQGRRLGARPTCWPRACGSPRPSRSRAPRWASSPPTSTSSTRARPASRTRSSAGAPSTLPSSSRPPSTPRRPSRSWPRWWCPSSP
ncbi:MAG: ABC transporter permease [Sandaracinaceae bacterium]|nr:ABC transporter permease [Sandaracinaceae bacterium]